LFRTIVIEVTRRCNNRCEHCYNPWREAAETAQDGSRPEILTVSQIKTIVDGVRREIPLEVVALSGGEPLLRSDLPEIANWIVERGMGVTVITNGTMLTPERIRRLSTEITFEVTLFSASERIHNLISGRPVFSQVIQGIAQLESLERDFVIAYVATARNVDHAGQTLKLSCALGAQGFMYNRVNLSRQTMTQAHRLVPSRQDLVQSLASVDETARSLGIPVAASVPIPACVVEPGDFKSIHFGWCPRGGENSYYTVGAGGRLRPCNHSSIDLGDLAEDGIVALTRKAPSSTLWDSNPEDCRNCDHPLRDKCRGGCPAAAHECFGTANRMDPFVAASKERAATTPIGRPRDRHGGFLAHSVLSR
jgi:radical SAM protein with 4Fe4S-binding SPASM domain